MTLVSLELSTNYFACRNRTGPCVINECLHMGEHTGNQVIISIFFGHPLGRWRFDTAVWAPADLAPDIWALAKMFDLFIIQRCSFI